MLVRQLPEHSRVVARQAGMTAPWALRDEALATVADLLYALLRVNIAAYGRKGAASRLPEFEFPRPVKRKVTTTPRSNGYAVLEHLTAGGGRG